MQDRRDDSAPEPTQKRALTPAAERALAEARAAGENLATWDMWTWPV